MSTTTLSSAAVSSSPEVLGEIRDPDCNIAVWQREACSQYDTLVRAPAEDIRFQSPLSLLRPSLDQQLEGCAFAAPSAKHAFIEDVAGLATRYCEILKLRELEVRLEFVSTNSCRKWHADYVQARLITTLVGPGTQWLTNDDAQRVRGGADPLRINSMSPGDVGIFKGKMATDTPAVHRSPPIEGTGETRLLLVLNPASDR